MKPPLIDLQKVNFFKPAFFILVIFLAWPIIVAMMSIMWPVFMAIILWQYFKWRRAVEEAKTEPAAE